MPAFVPVTSKIFHPVLARPLLLQRFLHSPTMSLFVLSTVLITAHSLLEGPLQLLGVPGYADDGPRPNALTVCAM